MPVGRRLLLDTNVLMLLIVGTWDRSRVGAHRRTAVFTASDFDLLKAEMGRYGVVVTTPGVMTEASNLLGNDFHEVVAGTMVGVCGPMVEVVKPKEEVFGQEGFERLGFADASVLAVMDEETVIMTDDVGLYSQALYLGWEAVNFNHLRTPGRRGC